jgi:hypothetical protein
MTGRLVYEILLFLLPFALYGIYWRLSGRDRADAAKRRHPWALLFIAGLLLVIASFVWWALSAGEPREGVYVPPHVEDGRIVPGRVEPAQ